MLGYVPFDKKFFDLKSEQWKLQKRPVRKFGKKEYIHNLNLDNCIGKLSAEDWNIIFEFDEEYHRRGDFVRIFPNK